MVMKGYEALKEVIDSDGTLIARFHENPRGAVQRAEKKNAMKLMHMVGSLISESTPLLEFKEIYKGYIEMEFTREAVKEVYEVLVREGVVDGRSRHW